MKTYIKNSKQKLPISLLEAWEFISDPHNLKTITPDYMKFKIISGGDKPLLSGQVIEYRVTPVLGIPTKWVSEIKNVNEHHYFVDEQKHGPYALWQHHHLLREIPGGVEMEDIIDYQVPFGLIGRFMHPFFIKPKLDAIFDYRRKKLIELFGAFNSEIIS